jgi:hypothetical protein
MPPVICSSFWNEDEKEKEKFYLRFTLKQRNCKPGDYLQSLYGFRM